MNERTMKVVTTTMMQIMGDLAHRTGLTAEHLASVLSLGILSNAKGDQATVTEAVNFLQELSEDFKAVEEGSAMSMDAKPPFTWADDVGSGT